MNVLRKTWRSRFNGRITEGSVAFYEGEKKVLVGARYHNLAVTGRLVNIFPWLCRRAVYLHPVLKARHGGNYFV